MATSPSCFLPSSSQTGSLSKADFFPTAESHPVGDNYILSNIVKQIPVYAGKEKKKSQNTNVLSLPTLPLVLLHDLQGGSDGTTPSPSLSEPPLSYSFSGATFIPTGASTSLTSYGTIKSGVGWPGKKQGERIQNQTGRRDPGALNHLKEACSNLLITTPRGCILAFRPARKQANQGPFPTIMSKHMLSPACKYPVAPHQYLLKPWRQKRI